MYIALNNWYGHFWPDKVASECKTDRFGHIRSTAMNTDGIPMIICLQKQNKIYLNCVEFN